MKKNLALSAFFLLSLTATALDFGSWTPKKDLTFTGNVAGDQFGYTMTSGWDINSDGFDDIVIATQMNTVYIIYGGPTVSLKSLDFSSLKLDPHTTGFTITGSIGSSISIAGDINNDGYNDIITGATNSETVYVIYGGPKSSMSNINLWNTALDPLKTGFMITGYGGAFGGSVGAGDVDGDGIDDIVIGARFTDGRGAAFVIYGGENMSDLDINTIPLDPATTGFSVLGESKSDFLGESVTTGNVNGDKYADIIIGASHRTDGNGAVYVIYGRTRSSCSNIDLSGTGLALNQGFGITGTPNAYSGSSLSAGDVNGDGLDDIIVGGYGEIMVVYGNALGSHLGFNYLNPATTGFTLRSGTDDSFGLSVSTGDINKDGYEDIVLGARETNSRAGAAYVVYGAATFENIDFSKSVSLDKGFSVLGNSLSKFGSTVCIGDVNGDGFSDIIIGAPMESDRRGAAHVLFYDLCSDNCKSCSSGAVCDECLDGFTVQNSLCVPCAGNCKECSDPSVCTACVAPYFLDQIQCTSRCPLKTVGVDGVCEDCPNDCNTCKDSTFCEDCFSGLFLYQGQCVANCSSNTFTVNGACIDCPAGCSECTNESTCQGCIGGYFLTESSLCDNRENTAGRVFAGASLFLILLFFL